MKTFFLGLTVGLSVSGIVAWAGDLYDSKGQPSAPRGSIQQFDYFRNRQQQLDIQQLRQQADRQRSERIPCGK